VGSFSRHAATPTPNEGSITTCGTSATRTPESESSAGGGMGTPAAASCSHAEA